MDNIRSLIGRPGHSAQMAADLSYHLDSAESIAELRAAGVTIQSNRPLMASNKVSLARSRRALKVVIKFESDAPINNHVYIGPDCALSASISIAGSGNELIYLGMSKKINHNIRMIGDDHLLHWGLSATCNNATMVLQGQSTTVLVGDDCMFSMNIWARTSDRHAVIDLDTKQLINEPASIVVGPHVWVGQDCFLLKGTNVGAGSIVAARSLTNSSYPDKSIVAGSPAKTIRNNVTWTRNWNPGSNEIRQVEMMLDKYRCSES